jgi:energy-coupling factor transporter ATP-binding protein EcfA2
LNFVLMSLAVLLQALLGPSGAGKSTLMDILAQRKSMGNLSGFLLVNGRPATSSFIRKTAYVPQVSLAWLFRGVATGKRFPAGSFHYSHPASCSSARTCKQSSRPCSRRQSANYGTCFSSQQDMCATCNLAVKQAALDHVQQQRQPAGF